MEKKFKIDLIRVLTTENEDVLLAHERQLKSYFPQLQIETKCIPDQYEGIHTPELGEIAVPKIVATAKSFKDADMIIVSCADDPGRGGCGSFSWYTSYRRRHCSSCSQIWRKNQNYGITDYAPRAYVRMIRD